MNLKLAKVGGLSRARALRDVADSLGLRLTIEDTWGGDVTTAAVSHLAASTRPETLFTCSFFNDWTLDHIAGHEPRSSAGRARPPREPASASRSTSSGSARRSSRSSGEPSSALRSRRCVRLPDARHGQHAVEPRLDGAGDLLPALRLRLIIRCGRPGNSM